MGLEYKENPPELFFVLYMQVKFKNKNKNKKIIRLNYVFPLHPQRDMVKHIIS